MKNNKKSGWTAPKRSQEREIELEKLSKKMIAIDSVRLNVAVPRHIYQQFKVKVFGQNKKNMSQVIIDMILNYIEKPIE